MRRAALALVLAGCDAGLDQRLSIIDQPRILALVAEPAEARPGTPITYSAFVASPDGPIAAEPRWAFCTAPKPPTEDNAVSTSCVTGDALVDLGTSPTVTAPLPLDGCVRFGPDTPSQEFRPRDPDPTGGFYQPVRADVGDLIAFGLSRITCKLGSAPADVARDYDLRYAANRNPTLEVGPLTGVRADTAVTVTASWPEDAAETYLSYDQLSQTLVERREAMRVSWYATAGTLDADASAVGEDRFASAVATTWHTPGPGPASLWLVLRDSRGGVAARLIRLTIE